MPSTEEKESLGELIREFDKSTSPVDLDVIQRLRTAELFLAKGRYLTSSEATRLRQILTLREQLGADYSVPKLAFYMAFCGMSGVPQPLVVKYMKAEISSFLAIGKRLFDRQGQGRAMKRGRSPEERMAAACVRSLFRNMHLANVAQLQSVRETYIEVATVFLGTAYFGRPLSTQLDHLRRAIHLSVNDQSQADQQFSVWSELLARMLPAFDLRPKRNQMLEDIDRISRANHGAIRQAAMDGAQLMRVVISGFEGIPDFETPTFSRTHQYHLSRIVGPLPVLFVTLMLKCVESNDASPFLSQLRNGSTFNLRNIIEQLYTRSIQELDAIKKESEYA